MSDDAERPWNGLLDGVIRGMPITADLSRSDLLLVRRPNRIPYHRFTAKI